MNIQHTTKGDSHKDTTISFSVHVYPPRDPNYRFLEVDKNGDKYDYYLVNDKKHWYDTGYTRTIRLMGYQIITKKKQKEDPYLKEVVDYINTNYPLTT